MGRVGTTLLGSLWIVKYTFCFKIVWNFPCVKTTTCVAIGRHLMCLTNLNLKCTSIQKVDAPWSTSITTFKITIFWMWFQLRKWSLTSFLSISFWNFEKCQKSEKLLQLKAQCVKIQITQYCMFFIYIFIFLNGF